jgi:hypothetical protein
MASNILQAYSSTSADIVLTWTLASLANGASRECTAIDNTGSLYLDYAFMIQTRAASATVLTLDLYLVGVSKGTSGGWTDNATGVDAAVTTANIINAIPWRSVKLNGTTGVRAGPWSVAQGFGGFIPVKWGIIASNASGVALDATAGNHAASVIGLYSTVG